MEEFNSFSNTGDGWNNRIEYFAIQAMFREGLTAEGSPDAQRDGFPKVIITIKSLTIALD
jgi:hypothetical protein